MPTPTDIQANDLIINILSEDQYNGMSSHSESELYLVPETVDTVPTASSENTITSGAVYEALQNIPDTDEKVKQEPVYNTENISHYPILLSNRTNTGDTYTGSTSYCDITCVRSDGSIEIGSTATNGIISPKFIKTGGNSNEVLLANGDAAIDNSLDGQYFPNAIQDYDGNWYNAVVIGNQVWMTENMNTTHFFDGTEIDGNSGNVSTSVPFVTDTPYYFNYVSFGENGNYSYRENVGLLYNWCAAMNSSTTEGAQGIAPSGWHIPTDAEYQQLMNYVSSQSRYVDSTYDIGRALAAQNGWSGTTIGLGSNTNLNNATGWSGKPGGNKAGNDGQSYVSFNGYWWTSTPGSTTDTAQSYRISYSASPYFTKQSDISKTYYRSIRCISDKTPLEFREWYFNTYNTLQHIVDTPNDIVLKNNGTDSATPYIIFRRGEEYPKSGAQYLDWFQNVNSNAAMTFSTALDMMSTKNVVMTLTPNALTLPNASVAAASFVKNEGTNSQILLAGGSVMNTSAFAASSTLENYLPLAGGTMTGAITTSTGSNLNDTTKGINFGSGGHIGGNNNDVSLYSIGQIYLRPNQTLSSINTNGLILNGASITFNNKKVWWENNDGSGSGLDADLLDGKHGSEYVHVRPILSAYNNNASWNYYTASGFNGKYIRITFPEETKNIWAMIYMELSILQNYAGDNAKFGKMTMYSYHNSTNTEWSAIKCVISDNLTTPIAVYGNDKRYIYIGGLNSYANISINKIQVSDQIRNKDLTGITIDTVDALPESYITATIKSTGSTIALNSASLSLNDAFGNAISSIPTASISSILDIPTTASDVNALPNTTKYASSPSLTINASTYVMTLQLKDQDGNNIGASQSVDLPLETMVIGGSYNVSTKKVILTLQNENTVEFSIADLILGLQNEITPGNPLSADLVVDGTSNKIMTASERTKLSSINPTNPSNNQVLIYSSSNSQWVNSSLYWADLPIQIASNKTTSPTFGDVRVSENDLYIGASTSYQCHQKYDASLQCLKFIFD